MRQENSSDNAFLMQTLNQFYSSQAQIIAQNQGFNETVKTLIESTKMYMNYLQAFDKQDRQQIQFGEQIISQKQYADKLNKIIEKIIPLIQNLNGLKDKSFQLLGLYNQRNMIDEKVQIQTEKIIREILFESEIPEETKEKINQAFLQLKSHK